MLGYLIASGALYWLYPLAVALPVVINLVSIRTDPRHHVALSMSLLLVAIWGALMVIASLLPKPERYDYNFMFDTCGCLAALLTWIKYRKSWLFLLATLFAAQVYLDAAFLWSWRVLDGNLTVSRYQRFNDTLWLAQLLCVSVGGASDVVRRGFDRVRAWADRHHHLGVPT